VSNPKPHRLWASACPFDKRGTPVLGTIGASVGNVVVMRVETWTALCKEHPSLGETKFDVGMNDAQCGEDS